MDPFEVWWPANEASLLAFARQMLGNHADAEDAVQQCAQRVLGSWNSYDSTQASRLSWVRAILRNVCRDLLRQRTTRRGRTGSLAGQVPIVDPAQKPADVTLEESETQEAMRNCLAQLSQEDRALFNARYREETSYKDLAAARGVAISTIHRRLASIKQQLRDCIRTRLEGDQA